MPIPSTSCWAKCATPESPGTRPEDQPGEDRNAQRECEHAPIERDSGRTGIDSRNVAGIDGEQRAHASAPSASPIAPPINDSSTLSVRSWRMILARAAPSAVRMATSRARTEARASCRFATFAQAISSTNTTAPNRI